MTTLFKLTAPSLSSCALSIYIQSVLPMLLFSSYPLPTLTMHHIPLGKCGGLWMFVYPPYIHNMRWRPRFCTGWSDPDNSARSLVTIAMQHRSVDPSIMEGGTKLQSKVSHLKWVRLYHLCPQLKIHMANTRFSYKSKMAGIKHRLLHVCITFETDDVQSQNRDGLWRSVCGHVFSVCTYVYGVSKFD